MKRLFFILLLVLIVNLEAFGNGTNSTTYVISLNDKIQSIGKFYKLPNILDTQTYIIQNNSMNMLDDESCTTIIDKIDLTQNPITPNLIEATDIDNTCIKSIIYTSKEEQKLVFSYQINNIKDNHSINFAYTCADGYTNQYNGKIFEYGCFNNIQECTKSKLKDCIGTDTIKYTYLNIVENTFETISDDINFSEKDAYLVAKDITYPQQETQYILYFYKPLKTCCFDNDNSLNKDNINKDNAYICTNKATKATVVAGFATLFTDKFAPCSKIIAQVNKADCQDITNGDIIVDTKTCYGGPKDNFYVKDDYTIAECPVIASTTNHNYDDSAYTDRQNPDWSKFDASSCKFYGKNHINKTGFCDNGGHNCLYFENDYEIKQITICNVGKDCYTP